MSAVRRAALALSLLAFASAGPAGAADPAEAPAAAEAAAPAGAPAQAWDQAKVTALAQQLETATAELWDTFRRQPRPTLAQGQANSFFRLQQQLRSLRSESRALSRMLQNGAGFEETQPSFESMMQTIRIAQDNARRVFSGTAVREKADAARAILNQLTPYYQANPTVVEPTQR